jgi:membrane associated rhomboid family serine protease
MLIPYSTDAPIYHWPYATLGTIIVNVLIFFGTAGLSEESAEWVYGNFILNYGQWNPIQWLTSNYLHLGFMHVFGNMIVLWGIGIIVEGKVGWWRFLLIYDGLGIVQSGVEQTLMLFAERGGSLGASSIIYGLIAMSMVWAPRNELNCFLVIFYRVITFDMSVATYASISIAIQVLLGFMTVAALAAQGTFIAMTSQVLHLMGAALGFALAVGMLKLKWVDCENWDLFSVWQGRHAMTREQLAEEALKSAEGQAKLASHQEVMQNQLCSYLAANEPAAALAVHRRGKLQFGAKWEIGEVEHVQLISSLRKAQKWDDAVQTMVEYLKTRTERAAVIRLALAQALVDQLKRPGQALRVLARLDPGALAPAQQATLEKVRARAEKDVEEDPYEVAAEDW